AQGQGEGEAAHPGGHPAHARPRAEQGLSGRPLAPQGSSESPGGSLPPRESIPEKRILARPVVADRLDAPDPPWERLGLPRAARRPLSARLGHAHLLLTGLLPHEVAFLRAFEDPRTALVVGEGEERADAAAVSGSRAGLTALADAAVESGLGELGVALHAGL